MEWSDDKVIVRNLRSYNDVFVFLLGKIAQSHPYPSNGNPPEYAKNRAFLLSCDPVNPISDWVLWVKDYLGYAYYGRTFMPCNMEYPELELKKETSFLFAYDSTFPVNGYPLMICPYIRDLEADAWHPRAKGLVWDDADGELYKMTYDNRANPEVTLEQIKAAYKRLREVMDKAISSAFPNEKA